MIAPDVVLGKDVSIPHPELVNLYVNGANATIICGVTIGEGALVGRRPASQPVRDSLPSRLVLTSPPFDNAYSS